MLVQTELDAAMKEDVVRPRQYFARYYERCAAVVTTSGQVVDNVSLLSQAAAPLLTGKELFHDQRFLMFCPLIFNYLCDAVA